MNLARAKSIFSQPELCNEYLSCDLHTERQEGGLRREGMGEQREAVKVSSLVSQSTENLTDLISNLTNAQVFTRTGVKLLLTK